MVQDRSTQVPKLTEQQQKDLKASFLKHQQRLQTDSQYKQDWDQMQKHLRTFAPMNDSEQG